MSKFLERNKKKGLLAATRSTFKESKRAAPILIIIALLLALFFVLPTKALLKLPGGPFLAERLGRHMIDPKRGQGGDLTQFKESLLSRSLTNIHKRSRGLWASAVMASSSTSRAVRSSIRSGRR